MSITKRLYQNTKSWQVYCKLVPTRLWVESQYVFGIISRDIIMILQKIQSELKAPKGQYNSFGKYKYRSCEDIVEALKPILEKYECALIIDDEIVEVGGRVYVKAIARITSEKETIGISQAYAREAEDKKGMDSAQVTGATSSYARKYALNGLLAIDDTKDADATNTHGKEVKDPKTGQTLITDSDNW